MASLLTTTDNPFNPETQFDQWFAFDEQKGYHTCSYLARIARTVSGMSDIDYETAIDQAIDEICRFNFDGIYTKVVV